jgi:hypothetical protein
MDGLLRHKGQSAGFLVHLTIVDPTASVVAALLPYLSLRHSDGAFALSVCGDDSACSSFVFVGLLITHVIIADDE